MGRLEVDTGIGGTGVVGVLRNGDGPTVMLRADMDALPVKEDTGLPYASTATGTDPTVQGPGDACLRPRYARHMAFRRHQAPCASAGRLARHAHLAVPTGRGAGGRSAAMIDDRRFVVEWITIIGAVANKGLGFGFDHVKVEAQLDQAYFMMICRVRAYRQRQAVAIHNRHDFHAFSTLGRADLRAPALGHREGRVDKALFFVQHSFIAKLVGNIRQHATQHFVAAPSLKAPVHSLVVRIALRQHVPLRTCVEYPQDRLKHPLAEFLHFTPDATVTSTMAQVPLKRPEDIKRYIDALKQAGRVASALLIRPSWLRQAARTR